MIDREDYPAADRVPRGIWYRRRGCSPSFKELYLSIQIQPTLPCDTGPRKAREYTWPKILDILKRRGSKLSVNEMKADLDSRGFYIDERELTEDFARMFEVGLIEA